MSNLEETKDFLKNYCLQKCNHNSNENCICKVAICFKEIEKLQEQEKEIDRLENQCLDLISDNIRLKKVLEIIKNKTVSVFQMNCCKNVDEYNDLKFLDKEKLTDEEFNTLKRWLTNE